MNQIKKLLIISILSGACFGCNKYLDVKPDEKLQIPTSVSDAQAILDNYIIINNNDPSGGEVSADDYYLNDVSFSALTLDNYRNMYTWQKSYVYPDGINSDWFYSYRQVFSCNSVLETLEKGGSINSSSDGANVRGQALFVRAKAFLQLAVLFSPAYDDGTADNDLGIPLRLSSDFNLPSVRASNKETFTKIITDLKQAASLLPIKPVAVYRASKPAAYGLLARAYLYLHQFDKARIYADSCLQLSSGLLDFNNISSSPNYPIKKTNLEVIYESFIPALQPIGNTRAKIDSNLYRSYATGDLRKVLFFKTNTDKSVAFRGSYEGGSNLFGGIATDEIYLIRAEANVRTGHIGDGLNDLNILLSKRWISGKFIPYNTTDKDAALKIILLERRKELLMRGLRWSDLKRLNQEGAGIVISRYIVGQTFTLPANDLRYALALPNDLIKLSGLIQNPR